MPTPICKLPPLTAKPDGPSTLVSFLIHSAKFMTVSLFLTNCISFQSPAFPIVGRIIELRVQLRKYKLKGEMAEGRIKQVQSVLSLVTPVEFISSTGPVTKYRN